MRGFIIKYALGILIFVIIMLSGCAIQIADTSQGQQAFDPCTNMVCGDSQVCSRGTCICVEGYKECGNECIPDEQCCSDDDCEAGEFCDSGECTALCYEIKCPSNKICDATTNECACESGKRWCYKQEKCIPYTNCCDSYDCGRNKRCKDTINSVNVCIAKESSKCGFIYEKTTRGFWIDGVKYDVNASKIVADRSYLEVNGQKLDVLHTGDREVLPDAEILIEDIREHGGGCE